MSAGKMELSGKQVIAIVVFILVMGTLLAVANRAMEVNSSAPDSSSLSAPVDTSGTGLDAHSSSPKISEGQPADDGNFHFVVTDFSCGKTYLVNDNQFEDATAQGQWCVMSLTYKNVGSVSGNFSSSSQYVYDNDGKQYSADTTGTMAANKSSSQCVIYQQINPGVTGSCVVAYDVSKGVMPLTAMLHASSDTVGVEVLLSKVSL
jgi:hypothetical protein